MLQPGRKFEAKSYRFSINGQEKEKEINENFTSAEFWMYDSRIGRRWNVDPIVRPNESPYLCFSGNPIVYVDPLGNDPIDRIKSYASDKGITSFRVKENKNTGAMIMTWFSKAKDGSLLANSKLFKPTTEEFERHVNIESIFGNNRWTSLQPTGRNIYANYTFKNAMAQGIKINSFKEALYHSLKRIADEVYLGPALLDKVVEDKEFQKFQEKFNSSGESPFVRLVSFGGEPLDEEKIKKGNVIDRLHEVYKAGSAATHELTWVVRNTMVTAQTYTNAHNVMGVRYTFTDEFNVVQQDDKGEIYNGFAKYFEKYYHGYLGGSKHMQIKMNLFIPNK